MANIEITKTITFPNATNVILSIDGKSVNILVKNWLEKNMTIYNIDHEFAITRTEMKELIDAIFDYAEDVADMREQDHQADAESDEEGN